MQGDRRLLNKIPPQTEVLTSRSSMAGCGRDCCGRDSAVRGSGFRGVGLCSGVPWAMSCACGLIPDLLTGDHLCTGRSHASQKDPFLVFSRHVAGLLQVENSCFLCMSMLAHIAAISVHLQLSISLAGWGSMSSASLPKAEYMNRKAVGQSLQQCVRTVVSDLHSPHGVCGICSYSPTRHIKKSGAGQGRAWRGGAVQLLV